jgi:hypothetical protein
MESVSSELTALLDDSNPLIQQKAQEMWPLRPTMGFPAQSSRSQESCVQVFMVIRMQSSPLDFDQS